MGRRSKIDGLPAEQFDFVMRMLVDGDTDREIEAAFGARFKSDLPKTNLNRWRNKVGNELIERFKLTRYLGKQVVENLRSEGLISDENDYQIVMKSVEEHLLAGTQKFTKENPLKLLMARQEEERIRLRREKLELDKEQLQFDREKQKGSIDRMKISAEFLQDLFDYVDGDTEGIKFLTAHLKPFKEFLKEKYATEA